VEDLVIAAVGLLAVGAAWWSTRQENEGSKSYPYRPHNLPEGVPLSPPPTTSPASPTDYRALARQAALANGVPPALFARLITRESNWDPDVVGVTGDVGIAQLNPTFHPRAVAEDPQKALPYAARYLKRLFDRFGTWEQAVAAYNWGPSNLATHGIDNMPPSVQAYVYAVAWGRY